MTDPTRASGSVRGGLFLSRPLPALLPLAMLSAGWILFALRIVPWFRDQVAQTLLGGGDLKGLGGLHPPPVILGSLLTASLLLLAGLLLCIVLMVRRGGLAQLVDRLLSRDAPLAAAVILATGVLTIALLSRGYPSLGDARTHIARGWLWLESLRSGAYPIWTDLWYGGYPADQNYPPLAHMLQGTIGLLGADPVAAAKILAWLCRMAGAAGFALLCSRLHRDGRAGLLGGLIYALAPTAHASWVWEGRLPGLLLLAILPWALLAAERLATGAGSIRAGALLALAGGGLVLAHAGQARVAIVLVSLLFLLRIVPTLSAHGLRSVPRAGIAIGLIGGAAIAAGFAVPMLRDAPLLNEPIPAGFIGLRYRLPDPRTLLELLQWKPTGKFYIGLSTGILALVGIVRAIADRRRRRHAGNEVGGHPIGPVALLLLVLVQLGLTDPVWRGLDMYWIGGLMAAAGAVRRAAGPARPSGLRRLFFPLALAIVLIDLAPLSLVTTYGVHREGRERIYERLLDRLEGRRFLEIPVDPGGRPYSSHWQYAPTAPAASVGGPAIQNAPRAFAHQAALIDTVAHALAAGGPLDREIVQLLALHNVRYLHLVSSQRLVDPSGHAGNGAVLDPDLSALRVDDASPVSVLPPDGVGLGTRRPDSSMTIAVVATDGLPQAISRSLIRDDIDWLRRARPRPVTAACVRLLPNRMTLDLPDVGDATLRIARNPYPGAEVLLDGRPCSWREAPLGGLAVEVEKGRHRIEIRAAESRTRRAVRLLQAAIAVACGFLLLVGHRPTLRVPHQRDEAPGRR